MASNCQSETHCRNIYEAISVVLRPRRFGDFVGDGSSASTSIASAEDKKAGDNESETHNKEEITEPLQDDNINNPGVSTSLTSLSTESGSSSSDQEVPTLDPNEPIRTTTATKTLSAEAQEDATEPEIETATSTSRASLESVPASTVSEISIPVLNVSDPVTTNQTINDEEQEPMELGQDDTVPATDLAARESRSAASFTNRLFRSPSASTDAQDATPAVNLSSRQRIVSLFRLRRLPSMTRWAKWACILTALTCTAILAYALFERNTNIIDENVDNANGVTEKVKSSPAVEIASSEIEPSQSVSQSWWSTGRQVCELERERMRISAIRDGFRRYESLLTEAKYN